MNVEAFVALVPDARRYGQSYRMACPACGGSRRSSKFSFVEKNGKLLLHCFGGCTVRDICESLGLTLNKLFTDAGLSLEQWRALPTRPRRPGWRALSNALEFDSETHWLRAEGIFARAQKLSLNLSMMKALSVRGRA